MLSERLQLSCRARARTGRGGWGTESGEIQSSSGDTLPPPFDSCLPSRLLMDFNWERQELDSVFVAVKEQCVVALYPG